MNRQENRNSETKRASPAERRTAAPNSKGKNSTANDGHDTSGGVTNLKTLCGDRYVVRDDGTDDPTRAERVWCMEIPCRYGSIYPCNQNGDLSVWTHSKRKMRELEALGLACSQGGSDIGASESSYRFPVCRLDEIAKLMQAKKRRKITPEAMALLVARLAVGRTRAKPVSMPEGGTLQG